MPVAKALEAAYAADLDLVCISPNAQPPVCKIMDYGKLLCDANENLNNDGTYILFAVNLNSLPDDFEIYYDPNFKDGYYCKEPIPAQAIKPINTCNFKK